MRDSKLIHCLNLLTNKQRSKFRDFVHSPYFNKKQELADMYLVLDKELVGRGKKNLTEEAVWKKMGQKGIFDQNKFRKWKTALLQLCMDFFSQSEVNFQDPFYYHRLLKFLNGPNENRLFPKIYAESQKALKKARREWNARDYFYAARSLEFENLVYGNRQAARMDMEGYDRYERYLDLGYISEKFRNAVNIMIRDSIFGRQEPYQFDPDILLDTFLMSPDELPVFTKIWYHCCHIYLDTEREDHFYELKDLVLRHMREYNFSDRKDLHAILMNYCYRKGMTGHYHFYRVAFDINKELIARKVILDNEQFIKSQDLKNHIHESMVQGENRYAELLLEKLRDFIIPEEDEKAYTFNLGVIRFYDQQYEKAERLFHSVLEEYEDRFYGLDTRLYLIKIYYETGNDIGTESMLESFRMYLQRSTRISQRYKDRYNSILNCLRKLVSTSPGDHQKIGKLFKEINNNPQIYDPWLTSKLNAMVQSIPRKYWEEVKK